MNVIVIGSGGREHALSWKLLQSKEIDRIICIPGNGGTATLEGCENAALSPEDFESIAQLASAKNTAFVVVGPELPLSLGITDALRSKNISVFGPTQAGATLESSKAWAKKLMREAGIPTATSQVFSRSQQNEAKAYLDTVGAPIVVKADGLAAGKGVIVAETIDVAKEALETLCGGELGDASNSIVIEEFLTGQEVSVLALTDGITVRPLLPAQDHKQVGEGDTGPNTGGMGAYAPTPIMTPELMARIQSEVLEPTVAVLQKRGIDYRGVLYAGLMVSPQGEPQVLEFNCRFGDPETQAVLPLLKTPLHELLLACVEQRLGAMPEIEWHRGTAVCVVMAAGGYPGSYDKGKPISGIAEAQTEAGVTVFHAGTEWVQQQVVSSGGRVLGVSAIDDTFDRAIAKAYRAVEKIEFENHYYRRDIGYRVR
ncbi:MAG: phosphoribosylamine--glycine ligase [Geitlerinemataceae cyanobacterium]